MKTIIVAFAVASILLSCEEEFNIKPDLLSGQWAFESAEIEFSFDLYREYGIYKGENAIVFHPSIGAGESDDTLVALYNRTELGYQQIAIRFYDDPEYYWINLMGVNVSGGEMHVDEMQIKMPGKEVVTLSAQILK
jgi:hypothetical protein